MFYQQTPLRFPIRLLRLEVDRVLEGQSLHSKDDLFRGVYFFSAGTFEQILELLELGLRRPKLRSFLCSPSE